MIGIENQFLYNFKLGEASDFIREEDLVEFTLIEEAGNILPTWQIAFTTNDESIISSFNETNIFEVSFGKELNDLVSAPLTVQSVDVYRQGNDKRLVNANGVYNALGYLGDSKLTIRPNQSAVSVIQEIASNYFNYSKDSITRSNDSQTWIQPSISDRKFVNELWLHSDLGNGIPAIGISSGGDFIIKDLRQEGTKKFKWKFTYNNQDSEGIVYDGDYIFQDKTSFINTWTGYGRQKYVYDIESGVENEICIRPEPLVALTSKIARDEAVSKRFTKTGMTSKNTHENYWVSAMQNISNLAQLSATKIILSFPNQFVDIKVLDQIQFVDDNVVTEGNQASGFHSGIYFVTKVARTVSNRQLATVVEICRDSMNEIKTA
jgi:hypothetical protein